MRTSNKRAGSGQRQNYAAATGSALALSPVAAAVIFALTISANASAQQTAPAVPQEPPKTDAQQTEAAKQEAAKAKAAAKAGNTIETIVVTGIRRGIESAISVKKNSDSIVEAISAEDIGKLPDNSIAESIARLPGLAAQRVAGRAQTISIRGLSGDFAGTILNGREQVSTGDNRAVEFDQYPSELLSGVTIYKTPDASLIGQGLSGTIDLQTVRPLSFGKRTVAVSVRGEKNSLGKLNADTKDQGSRVNVSYIDQFANKTIGIALGYARLESNTQAQRWEAWGYPSNDLGQLALGGSKQFVDSNEGKRDGFMGVLEYRPNKTYSSLIDLYYSKFDQKTTLRGYEAGLVWGSDTVLTKPVIQNGFLTSGTWSNVKPVIRNDVNKRNDDIVALGWNNKLNFDGGWTAIGDLSYSKAKRDESILETYAGTVRGSAGATDTVSFTTDPTGRPVFNYGLNYADPNIIRLTDSGGWGQDGYIKFPKVEDELKSAKLVAKKDLDRVAGLFGGMEFGINLSDREKSRKVEEFFLDLKTPATRVPGNLLVSPTSLGFVGVPGILSYDAQSAYEQLYNRRSNLNNKDIINKDWKVNEKVTVAYAKFDIDAEVGTGTLRGNVGVQAVHTDQSSNATAVANNGTLQVPFTAGTKYNDFLPSLNIVYSFAGDQTFRFGAAKTIARARLDQLRASSNYSLDPTRREWSGDGGNPNLKPFKANAYDVSYEKYFGIKAYVGVALFYKELKTYIYEDTVARDFSGYRNPSNGAVIPISNIGNFKQPINGQGGFIHGSEFTVSLPLNLFTPVMDGFGVVASYSDTQSGIQPNGPKGATQPLPGLSRRVLNTTAYFEKYGFSARVSQRERSDYLGEVTGFGADREFRYIKAERITDIQLGYSFEEGYLKGLSFLFQVNNLRNTPYQTYDSTPNKPNQITYYGRTTLLGVNYKF
jgi:iron complex outermembrane recepter protein